MKKRRNENQNNNQDTIFDFKKESYLLDIKLAAIAGLLLAGYIALTNHLYSLYFYNQNNLILSDILMGPVGLILIFSLVLFLSKDRIMAVALFITAIIGIIIQVVEAFSTMFIPYIDLGLLITPLIIYFLHQGVKGALKYSKYLKENYRK